MSTKDPKKDSQTGTGPINQPKPISDDEQNPSKGKNLTGAAENFIAHAEDFHNHAEMFAESSENTSSELIASTENMVAAAEKFPGGTAEFPTAERLELTKSAEMVNQGAELIHAEAFAMSAEHAEAAEAFTAGSSELYMAAEHGAESLVHSAEHLVNSAELFADAESNIAESAPTNSDAAEAAEEFSANAEIYHASVETYLSGEDSSAEIGSSSEEIMHAAEMIAAESGELTSSSEQMILNSAELVKTSADMLSPAATGFSTAEGAEIMAEASAEMILGAESAEFNVLNNAAEDLFNGAEMVANAEDSGAEYFGMGATGLVTSTPQIIPDYSAAGTTTDDGSYYNNAGVFMRAAEDILNGAEELSPIPQKGLPNLSAEISQIEFSATRLVNETNSSFPLQLIGAEKIQEGAAELSSAFAAGEDLVPSAEALFAGAAFYVNVNSESVESFSEGGAEIKSSAEEFTANPTSANAEESLLAGAEEIKGSAEVFRYVVSGEAGAEVGGEDFIVGGSSDLAEIYVDGPEDLLATAESVLNSAEVLAEVPGLNPSAEAGAAELFHGAEKLILASNLKSVETAEDGAAELNNLNAAAAEVLAGAEMYVQGTSSSSLA